MKLVFTHYTIERHPSWPAKEEFDSTSGVTVLTCTKPDDSSAVIYRCVSHPYDAKHFDSVQWNSTKEQIKTGYGDRGIGVMVVFDSSLYAKPVGGVVGRFEVLAKYSAGVEYAAAIMTTKEALLFTAQIPTDEFTDRLSYFRTIVRDIKIK
jgi:hypothetical protein